MFDVNMLSSDNTLELQTSNNKQKGGVVLSSTPNKGPVSLAGPNLGYASYLTKPGCGIQHNNMVVLV